MHYTLKQVYRHHRNTNLQRTVDDGVLTTGDATLAADLHGRCDEIARAT